VIEHEPEFRIKKQRIGTKSQFHNASMPSGVSKFMIESAVS